MARLGFAVLAGGASSDYPGPHDRLRLPLAPERTMTSATLRRFSCDRSASVLRGPEGGKTRIGAMWDDGGGLAGALSADPGSGGLAARGPVT
jgi:hypothetical protein